MLIAVLQLLSSCKQPQQKNHSVQRISTEGTESVAPYLTKDHKGNPVLCWTERDTNSLYKLKYAIYDSNKNRFNSPVTVTEALNGKIKENETVLTNGKQSEHHVVIIAAKQEVLVAWVREGKELSGIYIRSLRFNN